MKTKLPCLQTLIKILDWSYSLKCWLLCSLLIRLFKSIRRKTMCLHSGRYQKQNETFYCHVYKSNLFFQCALQGDNLIVVDMLWEIWILIFFILRTSSSCRQTMLNCVSLNQTLDWINSWLRYWALYCLFSVDVLCFMRGFYDYWTNQARNTNFNYQTILKTPWWLCSPIGYLFNWLQTP